MADHFERPPSIHLPTRSSTTHIGGHYVGDEITFDAVAGSSVVSANLTIEQARQVARALLWTAEWVERRAREGGDQ